MTGRHTGQIPRPLTLPEPHEADPTMSKRVGIMLLVFIFVAAVFTVGLIVGRITS